MNETLVGMLPGHSNRIMHWHPETMTTVGMAMDGIHPSSTGYAVWAEGLSPRILASVLGLPSTWGRSHRKAELIADAVGAIRGVRCRTDVGGGWG